MRLWAYHNAINSTKTKTFEKFCVGLSILRPKSDYLPIRRISHTHTCVCVCVVPLLNNNYKLIGWAFEYVVRDNFNWNWVIYIYYALEKLIPNVQIAMKKQLENERPGDNQIEAVCRRDGFAFVCALIDCCEFSSKMVSMPFRNCGQKYQLQKRYKLIHSMAKYW